MIELAYAFAGAFTGFVVGLTSVGSGALMTPILLLGFGVNPVTAVGTGLWFAALTKVAATRIHQAEKLIDWGIAKRLWMGSLPASLLTVVAMREDWVSSDVTLLKWAIVFAVLMTVGGLILHPWLKRLGHAQRVGHASRFKAAQPLLTVMAGAALGALVTLTSVGAGALCAVALTFLYPFRLTPAKLIATDIAHAIPLALFAGLGHLLVGHVDMYLLLNLLLGSIPGVLLGAKLSSRLPQNFLRVALACVLAIVAIKLAVSL